MKLPSFLRMNKKVLIVEDDTALRRSLAEKFKERGYVVLEASTSDEAFTLLGSEQPSVFVLDLILPMKDGISLLEELRKSGYAQPVVILSNLLGSDDLRADATRLNASFYNKSSVTLEEIVQAVDNIL
jgi:two-component system, OmpR family, response regulator